MEISVKKIYSILLVLALSFTLTGCGKTVEVRSFNDQYIPVYGETNKKSGNVEKSIIKAAASLGWKTKQIEKNKMLATLDIRTHQLVVLITYDDEKYSIEYKDSINMKYNAKKNKIHRQYVNWVTNLIRTINSMSVTI